MNIGSKERVLGRTNEALDSYQKWLRLQKKLAFENPAVPALQSGMFFAYWHLADVLRELGQEAEATSMLRLARETIEKLPQETADDYYYLASVHALSSERTHQRDQDLTPEEREAQSREAVAAVEALQKAAIAGWTNHEFLKQDPNLKSLRERDDFKALVAQVERMAEASKLLDQSTGTNIEQLKSQQEAAAILEKLAEQDPQSAFHLNKKAVSQHAIGLTYIRLRHFVEAEKVLRQAMASFQEAAEKEPENHTYRTNAASTHLGLGEVHWEAERWPEAVRSWENAFTALKQLTRDFPSSPEAVDELREGHRSILNFYVIAALWPDAAFHAAEAFRGTHEPLASWSFAHASLRLAGGDVAGYEDVRRRTFQRYALSDDGTTLLQVLRTMTLGPDPDVPPERLIQLAEEGLKPYPKTSGRLGWTGMAYYRAGRYAEALPWFERSYVADRRWPVAYAMLALVHHRLGNEEAAREWLGRTDRYLAEICREGLSGTSMDISNDWAIFHGCMEAEILRREAATLIDRSPAVGTPWFALVRGRAYARLGEIEKAEAEMAVVDGTEVAGLWAARGRILAEMGQHERAEADFDRASQMDPSDPAPWVMRARCRAERGLSEEADAALGRAGELAKNELQPILQAGGWWVVGPFTGNGLTSATSLEGEADPSQRVVGLASDGKPAPELAWRSAPMTNWDQVLLTKEFGAVENASFYALAYVHCSAPRTATFKAVGDDQIRIWVNGQRVHESFQRRSMEEAEHLTVPLRVGRNTILVKVWNHSGSGWFQLRFADSPYDRALAAHNEGLAAETAREFARWVSQHSLNARPFELMRLVEAARVAGMSSEFDGARALLRMYVHPEYVATHEAWQSARVLSAVEHPLVPVPVLQSLAERGATVKEWYARLPLAIAHYRAGQFQEAIRLAEEIDPDATKSCTYPLRAMAYHRLGQAADARAWLGKTDGWHAQTLQDALSKHDGKIVYGDWFYFLILREEAKLLIKGQAPAEDPQHLAQIKRARERWLSDSGPQTLDARIANDPGNAKLLSARGRQYAEQGQWEQAAADYDKVLDITLALRGSERWNSPWHVAGHELAQWDELFEAVADRRPDDLELWIERGRYHLLRGRWEQAADHYARAVGSMAMDEVWFELACLRLLSGDGPAYRRLCGQLDERAGDAPDGAAAFVLARTCAIDGGSRVDPARVLRWAELAVASNRSAWIVSALGMSHYRNGQYEAAIARLEESNTLGWSDAGYAQNHFLLAMAYHRLGNAERAKRAFARATEHAHPVLPAAAGGPARCLAPDWLGIELLRREAEAMINGRPEADQGEQLPAPGKTPPSEEPAAAVTGAFGVGPAELPGLVQAEDFDRGGAGVGYHDLTPVNTGSERKYRNSAVDLDPSKDEGGGYQVGGVWAGEWLAYSVRVEEAGLYDIELRVSSPTGGGKLHLEFGGKDVTGPLEIPRTGDWNHWETITAKGIRLSAGEQVMRVVFDSAALPGRDGDGAHVCNLNWFRLSNSR